MLRALIFDVDGTLADTERDAHRPAFNAAFREFGLGWEWDPELYAELLAVTGGKERIRFHAERIGVRLPDDLVGALHAAKTRHYPGDRHHHDSGERHRPAPPQPRAGRPGVVRGDRCGRRGARQEAGPGHL